MSEFETAESGSDVEEANEERTPLKERFAYLWKYVTRRAVVLLSFGPGLLGVLWLLGRILKR